MIRTYDDVIKLETFAARFEYLQLSARVGESTFGADRYLNQMLYTSDRWRKVRRDVIIRDAGCDLAHEDYEIADQITVHHINPISARDIELERPEVFDLCFLICTSSLTHRAIHFGDSNLLPQGPIQRYAGDTCPWRKVRKEYYYGEKRNSI